MKVLGIDFGEKRIGLAISDELKMLARPLQIYSPDEFWETIEQELKENQVEKVVVGLPINMSGGDTPQTIKTREFAQKLENDIGIPVEMQDERLTSKMVESNDPTQHRDDQAAALILQSYLDKTKK